MTWTTFISILGYINVFGRGLEAETGQKNRRTDRRTYGQASSDTQCRILPRRSHNNKIRGVTSEALRHTVNSAYSRTIKAILIDNCHACENKWTLLFRPIPAVRYDMLLICRLRSYSNDRRQHLSQRKQTTTATCNRVALRRPCDAPLLSQRYSASTNELFSHRPIYFLPPPAKIPGRAEIIHFRVCRRSVVRPSINTYFAWRDVFPITGTILMKLVTNIVCVSGQCWKGIQGHGVKGQGHMRVNALVAEAYTHNLFSTAVCRFSSVLALSSLLCSAVLVICTPSMLCEAGIALMASVCYACPHQKNWKKYYLGYQKLIYVMQCQYFTRWQVNPYLGVNVCYGDFGDIWPWLLNLKATLVGFSACILTRHAVCARDIDSLRSKRCEDESISLEQEVLGGPGRTELMSWAKIVPFLLPYE